jgi:transposase-like protein
MMTDKRSAEKTVRDIRRATRRHYSAEEKIRVVLEGLRSEGSIAELCRREDINSNVYYHWSKEFLEAGKKRLSGDTAREATSEKVKDLRVALATGASGAIVQNVTAVYFSRTLASTIAHGACCLKRQNQTTCQSA